MGINIRELVPRKEISFEELNGKILIIDAFNLLYQMITTIRQRDGTPLLDSKGNITSHLAGLFSRTTNFMEKGMKLVFVFDGEAPALKKEERARRALIKEEALAKYRVAVQEKDIESMKKYASRTAVLTKEMIEEAKRLILAFGLPIIQAPSEGEAQAAYMVRKGDGYAVVSQDYDSLLYGATRVIHNLSVAGKKKKGAGFEKIKPELIVLSEMLNELGIDQEQLIVLSMLIGTDYNRAGIKGIGPKNGLKLVKEYKKDFDKLFKDVKWSEYSPHDWKEIFNLFKKMQMTDEYHLTWKKPNAEKIVELLVGEHDFSKERITSSLSKIVDTKGHQKGLGEFL